MNCSQCGQTVTRNAKFCPNCGGPISLTQSARDSQVLSSGNVSKSRLLILLIAGVISISIFGWFFFRDKENTDSQLLSPGIITINDGDELLGRWEIFVNGERSFTSWSFLPDNVYAAGDLSSAGAIKYVRSDSVPNEISMIHEIQPVSNKQEGVAPLKEQKFICQYSINGENMTMNCHYEGEKQNEVTLSLVKMADYNNISSDAVSALDRFILAVNIEDIGYIQKSVANNSDQTSLSIICRAPTYEQKSETSDTTKISANCRNTGQNLLYTLIREDDQWKVFKVE